MKKSFIRQTAKILFTASALNFSMLTTASENNISQEQLLSEAEEYVLSQLNPDSSNQVNVKVNPIDSRLSIPQCNSGLQFSASIESLNRSIVTVKADCPDSNWYMFLVVAVTQMQSVVVISSAVSPGTVLTEDNIKVVEMNKKLLRRTTFADTQDVIGARVKRRTRAGRPVDPNNLCFVCKGDSIVINAGSPGMQVKASGVALEDGNLGDTIFVRNSRSKKKIDAQVVSTNEVKVII
ncbi:MAG: flagella basal body P-ring formation protein FlgA [Paraglaciecola sp.]|jgi:flagella basal body P-ring formation protein FlgA